MARVSRRRLFALAGGGVALASGCARGGPPSWSPPFSDDVRAVPDGPLDGRRSSSGHLWRTTGAGTDPAPVVLAGAIGPPAGHVPGSSGVDAGYAGVDLGRTVESVGADVRWDRSTATSTALGMGAFTFPTVDLPEGSAPGEDTEPGPNNGGSSMHLSLAPVALAFSVFRRGVEADFTTLVADGHTAPAVVLPQPMACDGSTLHRVEITLDRPREAAIVTVGGLPPLVFRHPFVANVPARFPFFEFYSVPGGTNLPRFARVWAS